MSDDRQDASPARQRAMILLLAEKDGYRILRWYSDEGISGLDEYRDHRIEYLRMIEDARVKRDFVAVLVFDTERFGRLGENEYLTDRGLLCRYGVPILHPCGEPKSDWRNENEWINSGVKQKGRAGLPKTISKNVKSARDLKHAAGIFCGGVVVYGFQMSRLPVDSRGRSKLDGIPVLDPETAPVVAEIFARYERGEKSFTIAKNLNLRGIPSPAGRKWSSLAIIRLLDRPEYFGRYPMSNRKKDPEGTKWVECERIVSAKTQAAVSRRLAARQKVEHRRSATYVLSGVTYCSMCGSRLNGTAVTNSKRHVYYRCSQEHNAPGAGCPGQYVQEGQLVSSIKAAALAYALSCWEQLTAALNEPVAPVKDASAIERKRQEKRLAELDQKIRKAQELFCDCEPDMRPEVAERLRDLRADRESVAALAAAAVPVDPESVKAAKGSAVDVWASRMEGLSTDDAEALKATLASMIERIDVHSTSEQRGSRRRVTSRKVTITFKPPISQDEQPTCRIGPQAASRSLTRGRCDGDGGRGSRVVHSWGFQGEVRRAARHRSTATARSIQRMPRTSYSLPILPWKWSR